MVAGSPNYFDYLLDVQLTWHWWLILSPGAVSITDAGMVESRKEEAEGRGEDGDEGFEDSTKGTKALICVLSCEPS